jgi:hypothetical protein
MSSLLARSATSLGQVKRSRNGASIRPDFVVPSQDEDESHDQNHQANRKLRHAQSETAMRKLMLPMFLGLGLLGFAMPDQAKASWLSETLDHSQVQVNVGVGPVYAGFREGPTYSPPAYGYRPAYAPAYRPEYRPAPVYQPQHSYYGPSRFEPSREWHEGRR